MAPDDQLLCGVLGDQRKDNGFAFNAIRDATLAIITDADAYSCLP